MAEMDTIYALSSGKGRAGLAVIRVSGPRAGAALAALGAKSPEPRLAQLCKLHHPASGYVLDEGLVLWFPQPASFTGEDVGELHVHGGLACTASVLAALGSVAGLRPAEAGEFTRRAFHNGRLDLTQVEGLADLIDAETEAQRRQALRQMEGQLGQRCAAWRQELMRCLAYFEAEIDFPDEQDVPEDVGRSLQQRLMVLASEIGSELSGPPIGERLREGLRVVIAGAPNVGKSSLLNLLAKRDAAIVSAQAGTTRDVIEVHLDLEGYPVILVDTAGLREVDDDIEREGVERARRNVQAADIVVWVGDATVPGAMENMGADMDSPALRVINKSDLVDLGVRTAGNGDAAIWVSAKTGAGMDALVEALKEQALGTFGGGEASLITRERHRAALRACCDNIELAMKSTGTGVELVAENLRRAGRDLGRVTGVIDVEDLLDVIFRDFCIGK